MEQQKVLQETLRDGDANMTVRYRQEKVAGVLHTGLQFAPNGNAKIVSKHRCLWDIKPLACGDFIQLTSSQKHPSIAFQTKSLRYSICNSNSPGIYLIKELQISPRIAQHMSPFPPLGR